MAVTTLYRAGVLGITPPFCGCRLLLDVQGRTLAVCRRHGSPRARGAVAFCGSRHRWSEGQARRPQVETPQPRASAPAGRHLRPALVLPAELPILQVTIYIYVDKYIYVYSVTLLCSLSYTCIHTYIHTVRYEHSPGGGGKESGIH